MDIIRGKRCAQITVRITKFGIYIDVSNALFLTKRLQAHVKRLYIRIVNAVRSCDRKHTGHDERCIRQTVGKLVEQLGVGFDDLVGASADGNVIDSRHQGHGTGGLCFHVVQPRQNAQRGVRADAAIADAQRRIGVLPVESLRDAVAKEADIYILLPELLKIGKAGRILTVDGRWSLLFFGQRQRYRRSVRQMDLLLRSGMTRGQKQKTTEQRQNNGKCPRGGGNVRVGRK